ncbi:MAG: sugar ABC transporter permease [Spirochaetae bacterium HGW-Spirochaetae-4]|nr:MAG: sugar ABC transporter permease [Spirochaetae bacterium HGW-Spirochaetae-4]
MKPKRQKGNFHQTITPLLFLLPNMVIFVLFIIVPAFQGLRMSFMRWGIFTDPKFVGIANFKELLGDSVFWVTFRNTLVYSVSVVLLLVVVSLILALLLKRNSLMGEKIFRAVFYIPSLLSMIAVGIAWRFVLGDEMGVLNHVVRSFGGDGINWLTDGRLAMTSVILVSGWALSGYYMVIFISGLQAIPTDLYEAARIDGSTPWKTFWLVTLPLLKSTVLVVVVLSTIASFKAYELIFAMTKGGPGYATKFIVQQVYQVAFMEDRMGYASAMSIVLMVVIGVFTAMQFVFSGKDQGYE